MPTGTRDNLSRATNPDRHRRRIPEGGKSCGRSRSTPGRAQARTSSSSSSNAFTRLYDSAANGSELLDSEFGQCVSTGHPLQSIAVNGASGTVYISVEHERDLRGGQNGQRMPGALRHQGLPERENRRQPLRGSRPVQRPRDRVRRRSRHRARVRRRRQLRRRVRRLHRRTERPYRVAVDSACATHEPPLDETTTPTCKAFDPANGTAYVAFDDPSTSHPPYDVTAFGPLNYGRPPTAKY